MRILAVVVIGLAAWSMSFTSYAQSGAIVITASSVSVQSTSTTSLAADPQRKFLLLINDSDTNIYCKFGATAIVHQGVLLVANGGGLLLDTTGVTQQAMNCITLSGSNKVLLVNTGK